VPGSYWEFRADGAEIIVEGARMLKEFKEFAMRGNVLDLAVALILGIAFGAIITSLVNDIVMPPIGLVLGKVDFKDLFLSLNGQSYATLADAKKAAAPVIAYGQFLNTVINFLIVAFVVFMIVKQANRFKKPVITSTKECPFCASAIALKARRCPNCTSELLAGTAA
jgi:large conductance mechanosensitive channel